MIFDVLTIFPEAFESFLQTSIIGRAVAEGKITVRLHDIRDFSQDKHRKVDDEPFGGGAGMVMMCQPLFDAIEHVRGLEADKAPVIFLTPSNKIFDQEMAEDFAHPKQFPRLILLCGNYEGVDQRVRDNLVDEEISVGDFVLTGGELPAQIMIDAIARLLPGVIGKEESHQEESFSQKLGRDCLEYPHYTRPADFRGRKVPDVLLSGHHAEIEKWRQRQCKKRR
ncbi:MAG: tRNA (guanosine(37)-N1)-methyltransferase TrmD [Candidatus Gracilibacteria bacterium]|nr:tRNA (guanosine(37)-N1)-methyltransferase TrmD [Candidatus Gracilibacteria bacterium]